MSAGEARADWVPLISVLNFTSHLEKSYKMEIIKNFVFNFLKVKSHHKGHKHSYTNFIFLE